MTYLSRQSATAIFIVLCAWALGAALHSAWAIMVAIGVSLPGLSPDFPDKLRQLEDVAILKKICSSLAEMAISQPKGSVMIALWGFWFIATWAVVLATGCFLLYRHIGVHAGGTAPPPTWFDRALSGRWELRKAFWGLYVGASLGALLVLQAPINLLRNAGIIRAASIPDSILTSMAYSACLVIQLVGAICAWRCARNTTRKVWRYLAWAAIIVLTVLPLLRLAYVMQSSWPYISRAIDSVAVDVTRKEPASHP